MIVDDGFIEDLRHGPGGSGRCDELSGPMHVVGTKHHVDISGPLSNDVAVLLGQTASHHDLTTVTFGLPRLQMAERSVEFVVGVLADAAGIEHDHVSVGFVGDGYEPVCIEQARDPFGVVLVHLAPEGAHDVGTGSLGHSLTSLPALPKVAAADWNGPTSGTPRSKSPMAGRLRRPTMVLPP